MNTFENTGLVSKQDKTTTLSDKFALYENKPKLKEGATATLEERIKLATQF